jgi:hypothetical protein
VNLKNLTISRLFYYQALRIVERAVLQTALVKLKIPHNYTNFTALPKGYNGNITPLHNHTCNSADFVYMASVVV